MEQQRNGDHFFLYFLCRFLDGFGTGDGEEERQCWVCFASEEDDPVAAWVHPCLCKGTTKWVHQVDTINVKVQTVNLSFLGLYSAVGRRETEREQQHGCRLSSMWRRLYHPGPNSRLNTRNFNIFVLSSLPLLRFSVCWMPWTSWSSPSILSITKFKYWAPVKNNRNLPGWPIVPCCCWWCVCGITVLDLRHIWGCHSNAGRKLCLSSEWRSKICKEALSLDMM